MDGAKKRRKLSSKQKEDYLWGWIFVLPMLIGLCTINIYPIFYTIYQSFCKVGSFGKGNEFVGFQNYITVFSKSEVWQAFGNTVTYAICEVPIAIALALIIAALLNEKIKFRSTYRVIFFLPMVAAPAAVAMVWRWIFNSEFGLLNNIIGTKILWISNPDIAIYSLAAIGIWSSLGYNIIIFLAGLQEIPVDYYEAASIDGATGIKSFFHITLPLLSPSLFFVCVTRIIGALQMFDLVYMMIATANPALQETQTLVYLFYQYTFSEYNTGNGATIVVFLLAFIMVLTSIQLYAQKKWVHYS